MPTKTLMRSVYHTLAEQMNVACSPESTQEDKKTGSSSSSASLGSGKSLGTPRTGLLCVLLAELYMLLQGEEWGFSSF